VASRKQVVRKAATNKKNAASKQKHQAKARPARKQAAGKKTTAKQASRKKTARKVTRKAAALRKPTGQASPGLLEEIEALAKLMKKHALIDVSFAVDSSGTKEIHVSRGGVPGIVHGDVAHPASPAAATPDNEPNGGSVEPTPVIKENLHAFVSPMVGTFFRAPSPEAPAFVSVGDRVDSTGPVCIIEAMKVMNEITPDVGGDIVSIEVENGEAVEFGQTLMLIRLS
jgi:acetyl-CoA carboxylase biotin carboxyl carrier protein